ncbi:hypothetical protein V1294_006831 [Bradyrhizobium sp. AZCC 1678]|uniref:hypothetical protein n=1 Tax=Bradyrhizobium sp. AZCC 1678 TaxID=3117030 RepID=UPI002FF013BD
MPSQPDTAGPNVRDHTLVRSRPAQQSHHNPADVPSSFWSVVVDTADAVRRKFGLKELASLAAAYFCMSLLFQRAAGERLNSQEFLTVLFAFWGLFLQLRLMDDLADMADDRDGRFSSDSRYSKLAMGLALAVTSVAIVLLSRTLAALSVFVLAFGVALLGEFHAKRRIDAATSKNQIGLLHWLSLAALYEGAPLLMFLYPMAAWQSPPRISVAPQYQLLIALLFWSAYEFWKYSRHVTHPQWNSYGFEWTGTRRVLLSILILSQMIGGALAFVALVPWKFVFAHVALCGVFGVLVFLGKVETSGDHPVSGLMRHIGILFVAALEFEVLLVAYFF